LVILVPGISNLEDRDFSDAVDARPRSDVDQRVAAVNLLAHRW
jgi:hypothetical protein